MDSDAAVDIEAFGSFSGESGVQGLRCFGRVCYGGQFGGDIDGVAAEYDDGFFVGPGAEGEGFFIGVAAHYQDVDGVHKSCVAAILAFGDRGIGLAQPVEVAVWAGDKTVESGGDEDGRLGGHGRAHIGRSVG